MRHVLLLGDSLAFHGPQRPEPLTEPRLYPNVLSRALGAHVDVVARLGWTARDAWWALTRDPAVYSVLLPRADAVALGVGGMDQLPASIPTYLREGLAYLRPGWLRRAARRSYHAAHPLVLRATRGHGLRQLPQRATDTYLSRCVQGIRYFRPGIPVVALAPAPFAGRHYPATRTHPPARGRCRPPVGGVGERAAARPRPDRRPCPGERGAQPGRHALGLGHARRGGRGARRAAARGKRPVTALPSMPCRSTPACFSPSRAEWLRPARQPLGARGAFSCAARRGGSGTRVRETQ